MFAAVSWASSEKEEDFQVDNTNRAMISGRKRLTSEFLLFVAAKLSTLTVHLHAARLVRIHIFFRHILITIIVYDFVVADFDKTVGYKYLRGMHLNDSKAALGTNKDRHENIGMYVFFRTFPYRTLS